MIISLSGKKQAGKSTITEYLLNHYGFEEISWAWPLKEVIGFQLLGLTEHQLYGFEKDKETVDPFWGKSPRELLQLIGTECFRKIIDEDFWVKVGVRRIQDILKVKENPRIVVSDSRFPNEVEAIKNLGGISVRIERTDVVSTDSHASETSLDNYSFDRIIRARSGEVDWLCMQMSNILETEKKNAIQNY